MRLHIKMNWILGCCLALATASCNDPSATAPHKVDATTSVAAKQDGDYAIATAHPLATAAGEKILQKGGSAVDAAVAVQAVLSLVEPQSSGLAGGAFLLHYDPATSELTTFDGRETAPASATADMFLKEDGTPMGLYDAVTGGRSVGVPGVIAMLALAHENHGHLPFSELFIDAHALSVNGFAVTPRLHESVKRMATRGKLAQSPDAAAYFLDGSGAPWPVGHILKNPDYGRTLQYLMEQGPIAFYAGPIADEIALSVNEVAGPAILSIDDFLDYAPQEREAVCTNYRTKKICSMGPPSSGGVTVLQILALLEQTGFANHEPASPAAWHLLLEASRLAYADRNIYVADPISMGTEQFTADDVVNNLLSPAYVRDRAALILEDRSSLVVEAGKPLESGEPLPGADASPEPPSTSHFSIMDREGRVVSMTTSVEFPFGSHLMAGGMILNNQLTDFSFLPERDGQPVVNSPATGKRPRSSMTPVIVFNEDGSVFAAIGSPGGPAIIGYVAKTLVGVIDWNLSLQEAIDLPNIVVPRGGVIVEDERLDEVRLEGLKAFGHEIRERDLTSGLYGFVLREDGTIESGVDKRREGTFASSQQEG